MGYVAIRGGEEAILNAETLLHYSRGGTGTLPLTVEQIQQQLHLAVDRVMAEGGLYAPELAAAALKQSAGDTLEASFLIRAHRSSISRIGTTEVIDTEAMRVVRRISAAFKDIPGGQLLGATPDYTHRLIQFELMEEPARARAAIVQAFEMLAGTGEPIPDTFPKVLNRLRAEGLLPQMPPRNNQPFDVTLESVEFPVPRSGRLQLLARAETGGALALAYAAMRGYGQLHPAIGELRIGDVPVRLRRTDGKGSDFLGWVRVTECEVITQMGKASPGEKPQFSMGYGLCFGHNEVKAISMALLDRTLGAEKPRSPTEDQEFVLLHTDGIESSGFCLHYKLPHYVSFQADLAQLRRVRDDTTAEEESTDG